MLSARIGPQLFLNPGTLMSSASHERLEKVNRAKIASLDASSP